MTQVKHKDNKLVVVYVVHDPIVLDSYAKFALSPSQLQASQRTRLVCKSVNGAQHSAGNLAIELT